jgi:hypothetical protein
MGIVTRNFTLVCISMCDNKLFDSINIVLNFGYNLNFDDVVHLV